MLGYAQQAWWRSCRRTRRHGEAGGLRTSCETAWPRQDGQPEAAWFGALRNMALTPATAGWLERVGARPRRSRAAARRADYSTLALELAVREVDGWRGS